MSLGFVHPDDVEKVREQLNLQLQDGSSNVNTNSRVLDLKTGTIKKDGHPLSPRLGKFLLMYAYHFSLKRITSISWIFLYYRIVLKIMLWSKLKSHFI